MTVLSGGSVSTSAGGVACPVTVDSDEVAGAAVDVGDDMKLGILGLPLHEVMIRLIKRMQFEIREKRDFVMIPRR